MGAAMIPENIVTPADPVQTDSFLIPKTRKKPYSLRPSLAEAMDAYNAKKAGEGIQSTSSKRSSSSSSSSRIQHVIQSLESVQDSKLVSSNIALKEEN